MTLRAVLLADGPSDLPLATHLEALCLERGRDVRVTAIDPRPLKASGRSVADRLRLVPDLDIDPDLVFVHRDAEARDPGDRTAEIRHGAAEAGMDVRRVVPVVPVRMTEAWLLLDEGAIRRVAGRPEGSERLDLPGVGRVESTPDPKAVLRKALLTAGAPSGSRRRRRFERDFERQRRLLLERLDPDGPVTQLAGWVRLREAISAALHELDG